MKVLVCGDRNWTDAGAIACRLRTFPPGTVVIHGDARGADRLAGEEAGQLGFAVQAFPAEWSKFGLAAGPVRNRQMLDQHPDLVLAFHENLSRSKGTADCIRQAKQRGIPVELIGRIEAGSQKESCDAESVDVS